MWRSPGKIHSSICLALLTFLLVTIVIPLCTPHPSFARIEQNLNNTSQLLQQGLTFYQEGKFIAAAQIWQQVANREKNLLNRALSLNYLSLAQRELGQWEEAQKSLAESLKLLQSQPNLDRDGLAILARALNNQGSLQFLLGQPQEALNTWKESEQKYTAIGDREGILGTQLDRAAALQSLGLYRQARKTLEQIEQQIKAEPDSLLKVKSLLSLGVALELAGDLEPSQAILQQSLALAKKLNYPSEIAASLLSLGNISKGLQDNKAALNYYQQAAETSNSQLFQLQAQLNQLKLLLEMQNWLEAEALFPSISTKLERLGETFDVIYARINFSELVLKYTRSRAKNSDLILATSKLLAKTSQQAKTLGNPKAESYALGQLGKIYEQNQQWPEAQKLTDRALRLAQEIHASEAAYQWQWQLGRILCKNTIPCPIDGNIQEALAAYTEAIDTLKSLRSDLVATKLDLQFSFRESVEPIYRELVSLLVQSNSNETEISQNNLQKAREVIEALQLAELDNFLRRACLKAKPTQIDKVDPNAAVIYPIILPDRLAVILSLPDRQLKYYETKQLQAEVENTVDLLLQSLHPAASNKKRLQLSQTMYDWLIRPARNELEKSGVTTLVFVLDGILKNLPMAALHDGQKYLVENYSIALTPGLQLLEAQALTEQKLQVLAGGLSQSKDGFIPLPGVELELQEIASSIDTQVILNEDFTNKTLQDKLDRISFPVVHLATHGQFSSKRQETFILTWDDRLNLDKLDLLLRNREQPNIKPIQLLVLSACQTALGDRRAGLGLAGVALQSGARSTVASLWSVNDRSTADLMREFYQQLIKSPISKAEAIRQAQLFLLHQSEYEHPFYWAPFVLIGNWL